MMADDLPGGHDPKNDDEAKGNGEESEAVTEIVLDSEAVSAPSRDDATQILPMRSTSQAVQDLPGTVIGVAGPAPSPQPSPNEPTQPSEENAATRILFESTASSDHPATLTDDDAAKSNSDGPDDPKTVVLPPASKANTGDDFNPPVGWLVITDGPGRGTATPIHYGQNTIGRGEDQRVRLNFGDTRIARETHAYIIYDEVERAYFLRDTGKANLVRLNMTPVLTPTKLTSHDQIVIGETTLLFIPLCNETFDWLGGEDDPATGPNTRPGEESI